MGRKYGIVVARSPMQLREAVRSVLLDGRGRHAEIRTGEIDRLVSGLVVVLPHDHEGYLGDERGLPWAIAGGTALPSQIRAAAELMNRHGSCCDLGCLLGIVEREMQKGASESPERPLNEAPLYIGGPLDGHRPQESAGSPEVVSHFDLPGGGVVTHYTRRRVEIEKGVTLVFFAEQGLSTVEAVLRLAAGYRRVW